MRESNKLTLVMERWLTHTAVHWPGHDSLLQLTLHTDIYKLQSQVHTLSTDIIYFTWNLRCR